MARGGRGIGTHTHTHTHTHSLCYYLQETSGEELERSGDEMKMKDVKEKVDTNGFKQMERRIKRQKSA